MSLILPIFSLLISYILGVIVTKQISIKISRFSFPFFAITLGIVLFTGISYFACLIFSFPSGIIIAQAIILLLLFFYNSFIRIDLNPLPYLYGLWKEKLLFLLLVTAGGILLVLFNHHIINPINGDLYTGESTYGDLPFHLSTISKIAYGHKFPPDNPFYSGTSLVYPFLINFFSAVLVYEGLDLRSSIILPGVILSFTLIVLIYEFAFVITKSKIASFLTTILYFFNGGLGFYFFLKDNAFNLLQIYNSLSNPSGLKEYSHLFEQNIQWGNFLSRMIVPERSLLLGIPVGIIILRLLFFRDSPVKVNIFDFILAAFLLSLMPLLHTHTFLVMIIILPILTIYSLDKPGFQKQFIHFFTVLVLTIIFTIPHIPLFLNHLGENQNFIRYHLGWMKQANESILWFWFKNTYLLIPFSLITILSPVINKTTKILQLCAFLLLVIVNLILFSPYDWDNVKFLFWVGLFFDIAAASFLTYLLCKQNLLFKIITVIVFFTMISSASLSILREINVNYVLFSKETVKVGEQVKQFSKTEDIFLTYKVHNSPVNNLAGRSIMMGYPGSLWVHGIDYQARERDISNIYKGANNASLLLQKYAVDYIVLESYDPEDMPINRTFFNQFPTVLKTDNYTIIKVK